MASIVVVKANGWDVHIPVEIANELGFSPGQRLTKDDTERLLQARARYAEKAKAAA